ncbi:hypothetical protein HMSSN036_87100 [Paenibacillus macerans]|nr:hypothetical protein HMSSN036_87100 [Paenibacillus macerans]
MGLYNQNILQDIFPHKLGNSVFVIVFFVKNSKNTEQLTEFYNTINHHITIKTKQLNEYSQIKSETKAG